MTLHDWGWQGDTFPAAPEGKPYALARVLEEQRGGFVVRSARGERWAEVSGRLAHESSSRLLFPGVGDWVWIHPDEENLAMIHSVLPRRNVLSRLDPSGRDDQLLAANVDVALIVTSANSEFSAARLERYAAIVRRDQIKLVIILSKTDLAQTLEPFLILVREVLPEATLLPISAQTGAGVDALMDVLRPGHTAILLGSSGVGKSTLINRLLKSSTQPTQQVREDDNRGRHTTTSRTLFRLPNGALLIDSPGLRQVALPSDQTAFDDSFEDVTTLITQCRFSNCAHQSEPSCAILAAIADGTLPERRYQNYLKLVQEKAFLLRRQNPQAARDHKKKVKKIHRDLKDHYSEDQ